MPVCHAFEEHAQDGRGISRAAERASVFHSSLAARIRALCAYEMLHRSAHVQSGQRMFVHGLSGGVGGALLRLGKLQGAEVFGTASAAKQEELRKLGAIPFDYADKIWIKAMREMGGADAVFDALGFESFDESYAILRKGGIVVGYGGNLRGLTRSALSSPFPSMLSLLAKNLLLWSGKRTTFFGLTRTSKNFAPDLEMLLTGSKIGRISVPVKAIFPLAQIQEAHRGYASSKGMGSIVMGVNRQ